MSEVPDLNDILVGIGRLQESVDRLRGDFTEEKRSAAASRKTIYERQDELNAEIVRVAGDVNISAHIVAQNRDEVKRLGAIIDSHKDAIQPSIDDWRRIKTLGLGVTGVLAIGGLSVGAMLTMGIDAAKAALRSWLGG